MALKFYTSVTKELRVKKFRELINKTGRELFYSPSLFHAEEVIQAQEARDNQFLFQNVQNNEIFEIFKMFKQNRWINVDYTKNKRLQFTGLVVSLCCTLFG